MILSLFFHFRLIRNREESSQESQRRVCRIGAGVEQLAFQKDTPGFPLTQIPRIVNDKRGFKKLELVCNHDRITQSSLSCLRTWRANCDVQILIYNSDPFNPSPEDIPKATDYIVGYACKGNESLKIEKAQIRNLILNAHDIHGDDTDVRRVARQVLNHTIGEKMISKQEAMVHIGQLKLYDCSEHIETHSLSGFRRLGKEGNIKFSGNTLLTRYAERPHAFKSLSLYKFFFATKKMPSMPKTNIFLTSSVPAPHPFSRCLNAMPFQC